ncbi:MAG: hypothetical protein M1817_005953 [Caeruleum heppii]|nr:MAG: hypothetical protein M1817_005953 [Caeruleum heppii]
MRRQTLPSTALSSWASFNAVLYDGVSIQHPGDGPNARGFAAIADRDIQDMDDKPLMTVPKDLILSAHAVQMNAKADGHLRELLDVTAELGQTARGAILLYLLLQITITSPDCVERIGVSGPFTQYVQFLAPVPLPTRWSVEEQRLLDGTSLKAALKAKSSRMTREFEHIKQTTASIPWCQRVWWQDEHLTIDDWLLVDAWYRSRALGFAVAGDAMVPCIDMLNHAVGEETSAYFDTDKEGNAVLLLPPGKTYSKGDEVTISYGDKKSASEMLFSYGFIETDAMTTSALTLDLEVPADDPLKAVKENHATAAPAVRLSFDGGSAKWDSQFVWLACVNEEDGLQVHVLQAVDGARELKIFWKEHDMTHDVGSLEALLMADPYAEIFRLRAHAIIQQRVEEQIDRLEETSAAMAEAQGPIQADIWTSITHLRSLERRSLELARQQIAVEMENLMGTATVKDYLTGGRDFATDLAEAEDR